MTAQTGLTPSQRVIKRGFDFTAALFGLALTWPLILVAAAVAALDTRANGFFVQDRVGMHGRVFRVIKLRTMRVTGGVATTVTTKNDARITRVGAILRRFKLDELPQLVNVLKGDMSFVGPRPDVPGFADALDGEQRRWFLSVRPGITGPATLKYRNEEELLAAQPDPEQYNREVVFPDKVNINIDYVRNWSFMADIGYIVRTLLPDSGRP